MYFSSVNRSIVALLKFFLIEAIECREKAMSPTDSMLDNKYIIKLIVVHINQRSFLPFEILKMILIYALYLMKIC